MKGIVFAMAALFGTMASAASGQDGVPDLKGTWTGKGKAIVFGGNRHHPGAPAASEPPRVRDIETTHVVEGQEGRVAWGKSASAVADTKEPFAWAIASDNKTIVGSDEDGYFYLRVVSRDRLEKCYVHNGTGPTKSIVASCFMINRVKK